MNRSDVTREQARNIERGLTPALVYLFWLGRRMEHVGFPQNDALYELVRAALEAFHPLSMHATNMMLDRRGEVQKRLGGAQDGG
jgi:hypothetical protein